MWTIEPTCHLQRPCTCALIVPDLPFIMHIHTLPITGTHSIDTGDRMRNTVVTIQECMHVDMYHACSV